MPSNALVAGHYYVPLQTLRGFFACALVWQAVNETQEQLEMLGEELDDMCRRLGMGDGFQVGI